MAVFVVFAINQRRLIILTSGSDSGAVALWQTKR